MPNERPWHDEREHQDAPKWLAYEESRAWADGWNAAVRAFIEEHSAALARETATPRTGKMVDDGHGPHPFDPDYCGAACEIVTELAG